MSNSADGARGGDRGGNPADPAVRGADPHDRGVGGADPYDAPGGPRPVDTPGGPAPGDTELGGDGLRPAHPGAPPLDPRDTEAHGVDPHGTHGGLNGRSGGDPHGDGGVASVASPSEADITSRTRTSGTWVAVIIATLVLVVLLVFILQNLDSVTVEFLGLQGTLPLGVALLFAAIAGALLVALSGAARILQLRRRVRRTLHR